MSITINKKYNPEFESEDMTFVYCTVVFAHANRYPKGGYTSIWWPARPDKTKEEYVVALAAFYKTLKAQVTPDKPKDKPKQFPDGITLSWDTDMPIKGETVNYHGFRFALNPWRPTYCFNGS